MKKKFQIRWLCLKSNDVTIRIIFRFKMRLKFITVFVHIKMMIVQDEFVQASFKRLVELNKVQMILKMEIIFITFV